MIKFELNEPQTQIPIKSGVKYVWNGLIRPILKILNTCSDLTANEKFFGHVSKPV